MGDYDTGSCVRADASFLEVAVTIMDLVVALSGSMAAGKTVVAQGVARQLGMKVVSFGDLVRREATAVGIPHTRAALQDLGQQIHDNLGPIGMVEALTATLQGAFIIDGVRHLDIAEAIRDSYPGSYHVHLFATLKDLTQRWEQRGDDGSLDRAREHTVETDLDHLRNRADLVVNTSRCTAETVTDIVVMFVGRSI